MSFRTSTALWALAALGLAAPVAAAQGKTLAAARKHFTTKLTRQVAEKEPLPKPPASLFHIVKYKGPLGAMSAYLTPKPEKPGKHPAIIWITGGFPPGGAGEDAWARADVENDQTAKQYRQAGMILMFPALRGSFGCPGHQETFLGEVDDVLAALEHLRQVDYVDPDRIYLGGHSTGGTLALLVSAATDKFRAVFAFGPVSDPSYYGQKVLTYDGRNERENFPRSPIHFLNDMKSPTYAFEGTEGNIESLREMRKANTNPDAHFIELDGADHFATLAPMNTFLAKKLATAGVDEPLRITGRACRKVVKAQLQASLEADALNDLAVLRRSGVVLDQEQTVQHYFLHRSKKMLEAAAGNAKNNYGFESKPITEAKDREGKPYYILTITKRFKLTDLKQVFETKATVRRLEKAFRLEYDGWNVE